MPIKDCKVVFQFTNLEIVTLAISCKKDNNSSNNNNPVVSPETKKILDTALADTREIYLWSTQIPASYNTNKITDPDSLMRDIRQFSKIPGYTKPVDRFSFAAKQTEWNDASSGQAKDFGMNVYFLQGSNKLYVKSVEKSSPAGVAGIKRGWQIKSINGSTNIDTTNSSITMIVQTVFKNPSTQFVFQKPDNSSVGIALNAASYLEHPIMADSVFELSSNTKIGYMVLNSFLGDSLDMATNLKRVFDKFDQKNITSVVIDLRYNTGGYVKFAETLSNYLAPKKANGQTMFTEQFNDKYAGLGWNTTFKFSKKNNLDLNKIVFIVSSNTASASEMLINNLIPFMDVKLVGPNQNTYGKPVGFFPIPAGDWYIFPVSFRNINNAGTSNYYTGFTVDKLAYDGVNKDWCDIDENCLSNAISYIQTGSFRVSSIGANESTKAIFSSTVNDRLQKKQIRNIAIETRRKF